MAASSRFLKQVLFRGDFPVTNLFMVRDMVFGEVWVRIIGQD